MAIITGSWIWDIYLIVSAFFLGLYAFYKHQFKYWGKKNVVHTQPTFPFGDTKGANYSVNIGVLFKKLYDDFKGVPYFGAWMLFKPTLILRDPELVKHVFVKDFMSFHDRGIYVNEEDDPLAAHLFSIGGIKWRNLRAKLSPTFTSGKMKMMFPILQECSEELKDVLKEPARRGDVVEMKEIAARFTTDIISSCAFGIQTNSLKNPGAEFRKMGYKIFEPSVITAIKGSIMFFVPNFARILKLTITKKDVTKFFLSALKDTMDHREQKNIKRNDFLQLLINLKNVGKVDDVDEGIELDKSDKSVRKFTFLEAAAQAFVFFAAGFETSSTTMQFALYELSLNPEIQDKAREEILTVLEKHDGKITYESIYEMDYLGRIIDETLRKYPPVPILQRECNKDFKIPDTNVVIPSGMQVQIPILGMQMDPEHFPNPEKFDPDRFTEEEKSKRHHYAYLPFGEGPRNCIGMRFGLMQTRVGLATLLSNYRFEISSETQIPIVFEPGSFILAPQEMMNLKVTAVN